MADLQHAMFTILLSDRLHLAPIADKPLHNVLDIATGECSWQLHPQATDVFHGHWNLGDRFWYVSAPTLALVMTELRTCYMTAEKYPSASIVGTDLSIIQPN